MTWIALILVAFGGVACVQWWINRASIPAYAQARIWSLLCLLLLLLLSLITTKALLWHQELVLQIRACR